MEREDHRNFQFTKHLMMAVILTFLAIPLFASTSTAEDPPPFLLKWGSFGYYDPGTFAWPYGIAVDSVGKVFVVSHADGRVEVFNASGGYLYSIGKYNIAASFDVAVDSAGNVYVAEFYGYLIAKFNNSGEGLCWWGNGDTVPKNGDGQFDRPAGVAVDPTGNYVYVADTGNNRMQIFTNTGTFLAKWGSYGTGDAQFDTPRSVAVDSAGNVYVVDTHNNRIQKFDSSGNFLGKWGSFGPGDGEFNYPYGIGLDSAGNVYVADTGNHRVQKFDSSGNFLVKWGSFGIGDGEFYYPVDVAVDSAGNVYVVDNGNHRVQKFGGVFPIANAGPDQTVQNGSLVTLDGTGSSEPGGNVPLTYQWSFVSTPSGSTASIANPTTVNPTFTPDIPGDYDIQLIVTNSIGQVSQSDIVRISTTNSTPVAEAGMDQLITIIGTQVQLNGSQSYDPDGNNITYEWTFISIPNGSVASLIGASTVTPNFIADVQGTYVAQLVVNDPWRPSDPDTVTISFENLKPVANAGTSRSVTAGEIVSLDGRGSSDANGDPLTYDWALTSVPANSSSIISNPTAEISSFTPDLPGTYVAQLVVNDGFVNSDPSTIQIEAYSTQSAVIEAINDGQGSITLLFPPSFKNPEMKNALINKLNAAIASIEAGRYAEALDKLKNDILGKTDGCATTGAPDKNDWITTCQDQSQVYPLVQEAIWIVEGLL